MVLHYLIAVAVILAALLGWVAVQHVARTYAARHPQTGPYREEGGGGGCGSGCGCCTAEGCRRSLSTAE